MKEIPLNRAARLGAFLLCPVLLAGCDLLGLAGPDYESLNVERASGNGQRAFVRTELPDSLVVVVTDTLAAPAAGVEVSFEASSGTPEPAVETTDREGRAATTWQMGEEPGTHFLTARVSTGDSVVFEASSAVPVEVTVLRDSATMLDSVPVRYVTYNVFGNPEPAEIRMWLVSGGGWLPSGGNIIPATMTEQGDTFFWGLGPEPGTQKIAVHRPGLESKTVSAVATGEQVVFEGSNAGAGLAHSCALSGDGSPFCWGHAGGGRLGTGDPDQENTPKPVRVAGDLTLQSLSTFLHLSCGLDDHGTAHCWGDRFGAEPGAEPGPAPFEEVDVAFHLCGLTGTGELFCKGRGKEGQLGNGSRPDNQQEFTEVSGERSWRSLATGRRHTCAVSTDQRVFCWGQDWGDTPVDISGDVDTWASVSAWGYTTCGLTSDGRGFCWETGAATPSPVQEDSRFAQLDPGERHTCGVTRGGTGLCWDIDPDPTVLLDGEVEWRRVTPGSDHTCGTTADGVVHCWGSGGHGRLGQLRTYNVVPEPRPVLLAIEP